jgi:hypothetical protein
MRILLIAGRAGDGTCGVADHALFLAAQLAQSEQVDLLYRRGSGNLAEYEPALQDAAGLTFSPIADFSPKSLKVLLEHIAKSKPDIVHLHYPAAEYRFSMLPLTLAAKRRAFAKSRFVVTLHEYNAAHPLRRWGERKLARAADAVITPSAQDTAELTALFGKKVVNIADGEFFSLAYGKSDAPLENREMQLLHYGLPSKTKDFPRLFSLFYTLRAAHPQLRMKFVAPAGAVKELRKRYLAEGVDFIPFLPLPELRALAEKSLLVVFPFAFDTHRSSLINALSFRTPLLSFGVYPAVATKYAPDLPMSLEADDAPEKVGTYINRLAERFEENAAPRLAQQARLKARLSMSRIAAAHLAAYNSLS